LASKKAIGKQPVPVPEKYNPHKVAAGQIWEDLDERNAVKLGTHPDGLVVSLRRIRVISLAECETGHSDLVENIQKGTRSFVKLASFRAAGKRGFKLVTGASGFPA
jgi:hypothetical protein